MVRPAASIGTSELATLFGLDKREIPNALIAAGITPLSTVKRGGSPIHTWPRADAMRALRGSELHRLKVDRDRTAHAKAALLDLREGLTAGTHIRFNDWMAKLETYLVDVRIELSNLAYRHAPEVAGINTTAKTEAERTERLGALLQPFLDRITHARRHLA